MIDFFGLFDGLCKSISTAKSAVGIKEDEQRSNVTYSEKRERVAKRRLEKMQQERAKSQKQSMQDADATTHQSKQ
jgi:hypothetical protein